MWKTWFPSVCAAKTCARAPPARTAKKTGQRTLSYDTVDVAAAATTAAATVAQKKVRAVAGSPAVGTCRMR